MAELGLQIRHELARYLAGGIGLREFRDWFLPSAWNIDALVDGESADLAHEIELLLSEFEAGHWLETELRYRLASQMTHYNITLGAPIPRPVGHSSSCTQWTLIQPAEERWGPADTRFEEASA